MEYSHGYYDATVQTYGETNLYSSKPQHKIICDTEDGMFNVHHAQKQVGTELQYHFTYSQSLLEFV